MDVNTRVPVEMSVGEWQAHLTVLQNATTIVLAHFVQALNAGIEKTAQKEEVGPAEEKLVDPA